MVGSATLIRRWFNINHFCSIGTTLGQLCSARRDIGTWLPGHWTFQQNIHQVYLTYRWKFRHTNTIRMVLRGICLLVISLLHDRALMSTHFRCIYPLYTVYILCLHLHMGFTYTTRIHLVYL